MRLNVETSTCPHPRAKLKQQTIYMIKKAIAESVGETTKHIIHFESGHEKTINGVISNKIQVGRFTKLPTKYDYVACIAHDKVEWFEIHEEDN